jgi:hypothetical protein
MLTVVDALAATPSRRVACRAVEATEGVIESPSTRRVADLRFLFTLSYSMNVVII